MADVITDEDDGGADVRGGVARLSVWVRCVALMLGFVSVVAGGYAVFVSENQAGTAALLVLSLIMLVIGLQGTPISRVAGAGSSVELAVLRDRARRVVEESRRQDPPDVAAAVEEAIASVDPAAVPPAVEWWRYERAALSALQRLIPDARIQYQPDARSGIDARIVTATGSLNVEFAYRRADAFTLTAFRRRAAYIKEHAAEGGTLMITNVPPSSELGNYLASGAESTVDLVIWRDERDNESLLAAIQRNAR